MECCIPKTINVNPSVCPGCSSKGHDVKVKTIKHWLVTHLVPEMPVIPFYFCKTRNCPVVYFSADYSKKYTKGDIRYRIGFKENTPPMPVCYCFGVTEEMILKEIQETGKSSYSTWIAKEVKDGNCACDARNPKGRCCLGDIKRVEGR
ncbi:MAG: copper chaperone Copz family protein [Candidatus Omnitrophica bacterium]|nr:copper chaperone Copz family protein [Candidatus Omnitrophota bacterium]